MDAPSPDPDHPIVDQPHSYRLVGFCFERRVEATAEAYLDLVLQRAERVRRLRFFGPQHIVVAEGFPEVSGLYIADVRGRGLEGLGVQVGSYEAGGGAVSFWARRVVELAAAEAAGESAGEGGTA